MKDKETNIKKYSFHKMNKIEKKRKKQINVKKERQ